MQKNQYAEPTYIEQAKFSYCIHIRSVIIFWSDKKRYRERVWVSLRKPVRAHSEAPECHRPFSRHTGQCAQAEMLAVLFAFLFLKIYQNHSPTFSDCWCSCPHPVSSSYGPLYSGAGDKDCVCDPERIRLDLQLPYH